MTVLIPLISFASALLVYVILFVGRRGRNLPPGMTLGFEEPLPFPATS
jgi:hypothetical protein